MAVCKWVYGTAGGTVRGASATWASIKGRPDRCSGRWRSPYRTEDHATFPYIQSQSAL